MHTLTAALKVTEDLTSQRRTRYPPEGPVDAGSGLCAAAIGQETGNEPAPRDASFLCVGRSRRTTGRAGENTVRLVPFGLTQT